MPRKKSDLSSISRICLRTRRRRQLKKAKEICERFLAQYGINYETVVEHETHLAEVSNSRVQLPASETLEQREIRLEADRSRQAQLRAELIERERKKTLVTPGQSGTHLPEVSNPGRLPVHARARETSEQRERRLEADRIRKAQTRAYETTDKREIRLTAERKLRALQRKLTAEGRNCAETPAQREHRLAEYEESKAQIYAWKREALQCLALCKKRQVHKVIASGSPKECSKDLAVPRYKNQLRHLKTSKQETFENHKNKRVTKHKRSCLQNLPGSIKSSEESEIETRLAAKRKRKAQVYALETPKQRKQRRQSNVNNDWKRIAEIEAEAKQEKRKIRSEAIQNLKALKQEATLASQEEGALDTPGQREAFLKHFEDRREQLREWKNEAMHLADRSAAEQIHELTLTDEEATAEYLECTPGSSSTSQDPAEDTITESSIKREVDAINEIKTIEVPSVFEVVNLSTSVKMEAEEVIPDVTIKNEIDIEEERLIRVETEVPDYLNTPTHTANMKTCETTQITIKIERDYETKDNTYLVERHDIVDKPQEIATFIDQNMPVSIKQENIGSMVSYDNPNLDEGGSMDSSDAAALANVETCLQDDSNIKTENGVHLEDSHEEEFFNTEFKIESDAITEPNSSNQIIPDITEPSKYTFLMKIPGDVMSNIDHIVTSCSNNSETVDLDYGAYLDREIPSGYFDKKANKESTSLLVESDKTENLGKESSQKKIQCPKCPKQFNSKYLLKPHLKVHQTIENYRSGLKKALETKRKNIYKKRKQLQQLDAHESQETCSSNQATILENKDGYKCICGKTYQRKTRMESCLRSHEYETGQYGVSKQSDNTTDATSSLEQFNQSEMIDSNSFQLNSITGNFLSLEQEAYNMMKQKEMIKCPKCSKTYSDKERLRRHLKVHQTIENYKNGVKKGLQKKKFQKIFSRKLPQQADDQESQDSCANHKDNKVDTKEGYECTCGKIFQRKTRMESCLRSHDCCESEKYYCMTCLKDFKSKDELALHRKRLHRKKFPCKFCPTDYATRKKLFKHLQIHQKVDQMEYKVIEEVVKEKKKLSCLLCSKFYEEISELKIHVMTEHKGPYSCPHCKNTFPKINDFANHTKTYHPEVGGEKVLDVIEAFSRLTQEWKCEDCGLQFLEADKLAMHQVEEHNPELKSEQQFQCPDCRRVFNSQKGLTSHRRIHHSSETSEQVKVEVPGILCLECRKMCKDMAALTSHMRFHSPDRKYPCKFCDFRFATPEKRKTHAEIHTGEMKYVCFICEYQCSSENRLKKHKHSLKHANMREYLLTGKPLIEESTSSDKKKEEAKKGNCSKDFESDSSGSNSDGEEVCCDVCGEKFPGETKMLEHKETHPFIEIPNADNQPTRIFFK